MQAHRDYIIKVLLNGMTGPLAGQTYTQVMLPMGAQNDQWISNIASYVRNTFGNNASFIAPTDVARVRTAIASRKTMWTYPELDATLPRLLPVEPTWKATASHNAERAASGLTLAAWTTAAPQQPDMWFQVELPQPTMLTEVQFDSGQPGGGGRGRGGRGPVPPPAAGRGGAPAGAPAQPAPPAGRAGGPPPFGSFPIAYKVQVSTDGKSWSTPVGQGEGSPQTQIVTFKPVQAKFVRITQTGSGENTLPWSVLNFRVYGVNAK